jgi:hypothetical protein
MDCASRLMQRLPLSFFEVSTAAHAFSTLLTYFVWWPKPLNVAGGNRERAWEVNALLMCSDGEYDRAFKMAGTRAAGDSAVGYKRRLAGQIILAADAFQRILPITNECPPMYPFRERSEWSAPGAFLASSIYSWPYELASISLSPILYGLVHFLAWYGQFPNLWERTLWRISSVLVAPLGLVWVILSFITSYLTTLEDNCAGVIGGMLVIYPLVTCLHQGFLSGDVFDSCSSWTLLRIASHPGPIIDLTPHDCGTHRSLYQFNLYLLTPNVVLLYSLSGFGARCISSLCSLFIYEGQVGPDRMSNNVLTRPIDVGTVTFKARNHRCSPTASFREQEV